MLIHPWVVLPCMWGPHCTRSTTFGGGARTADWRAREGVSDEILDANLVVLRDQRSWPRRQLQCVYTTRRGAEGARGTPVTPS